MAGGASTRDAGTSPQPPEGRKRLLSSIESPTSPTRLELPDGSAPRIEGLGDAAGTAARGGGAASWAVRVSGKLEPRVLCVAAEKGPAGFVALVERDAGAGHTLHLVVLPGPGDGGGTPRRLECAFPAQEAGQRLWITELALVGPVVVTVGSRAHNKLMSWSVCRHAGGSCTLRAAFPPLALPAYPSAMAKYGDDGRWLLIPGYRQAGTAILMTVAITGEGPRLLSTTPDATVRCITHVATCRDGKAVATAGQPAAPGGSPGVVTLWSVQEDGGLIGRPAQRLTAHTAGITALAFGHGKLVTADSNCTRVWAVPGSSELPLALVATVATPGVLTSTVAMLQPGVLVTAGLAGSAISVWDVSGAVAPAAHAPKLADLPTSECTQSLATHDGYIYHTSMGRLARFELPPQ